MSSLSGAIAACASVNLLVFSASIAALIALAVIVSIGGEGALPLCPLPRCAPDGCAKVAAAASARPKATARAARRETVYGALIARC